jgi:hypothetical protein
MRLKPSLRTRRSIQRQITTLGLALTALVLAVFAVGMVLHEAANRRQTLEAGMTTEAEIIGANSAAAVTFGNEDEANEILASLAASPDVLQARIFLPGGRTLGRYAPLSAPVDCHQLSPVGRGWDWRWCGAAVYRPITLHGKPVGTLAMEVGLESTYRALAGTIAVSLAIAGVAFCLSIPLWRPRRVARGRAADAAGRDHRAGQPCAGFRPARFGQRQPRGRCVGARLQPDDEPAAAARRAAQPRAATSAGRPR